MSLYFADEDNLTFGVQASNVAEAAQFSSTTNDVFMHLYTNNYQDVVENTAYGVAIGSSNYATTPFPRNDLYLGDVINNGAAIDRVLTMRDTRIGIRTSVPEATLHVVGSNMPTTCNILRIDAPLVRQALYVDKDGFVGIGTTPTSNQGLTVRGKLVVDNIQVGGGSSDSSSRLVVAYGLAPPSDVSYLDFGYSTMSNISNIVTPLVQANNLISTFYNIGNNTFLNNTVTTASAATLRGDVTFTTSFYGNAPSYLYTLTTSNVATGAVARVNATPKKTTGSVDQLTSNFTTGSYTVSIDAAASNGMGLGSYYVAKNVATFNVGQVDTISAPTAILVGTPTFSSTTITYSGVPYYTTGVQMTLPINAINFTNIYQTIDPAPATVLTLGNSNYPHSAVFTNHLIANATNTKSVTLTLASNVTTILNIPATVYNINGSNTYPAFVASVTYVGVPMSEINVPSAQYSSVPVSALVRMSTGSASPNSGNISTFSSSSPTQYDSLFSPMSSTFLTTYTALQAVTGTYMPTYTQISGTHNQLLLRATTTAPLYSFVLNLAGATGVSAVQVNWAAVNTTWYDATVLYTNAGGCAAAVTSPPPTSRFPVRVPQSIADQVLPDQSSIYINITFSGSIPMAGITLTNV